jgi:hypothetical protein
MRGRLLIGAFVLGLVAIGVATAGLNRNWSAHANGSQEVPPRETQAQAQAIFHLSKDETSIDYKLIAANIENVVQAHIHRNIPGMNGPIVVWLYPSTAPGPALPAGGGRLDGVIAQGTITGANIAPTAPENYSLGQLVADLNNGNAYVNLHTNDGVGDPNTGPGDFPGGEIRADVR